MNISNRIMSFLKKDYKLEKVIAVYIAMLEKEMNEYLILIKDSEDRENSQTNKQKMHEVRLRTVFLKGEFESKYKMSQNLKTILRNKNLMDDWGCGINNDEVSLKL